MRAFPRRHMSLHVCEGVVRRLGLAALLMIALLPRTAAAAPVLNGVGGTACAGIDPASPNCQLFDIADPVGGLSLTGEFLVNNDVALFRFTLAAQATFSALTSETGFDPLLALFTSGGRIVRYLDAEGSPVDAENDDRILDEDFEAEIPSLLLDSGTYVLALLQTGNGFNAEFVAGLGGIDNFRLGFTGDGEPDPGACAGCTYSVSLTAAPAAASVPEPGTLALLVAGASTLAFRRRSAKKFQL